MLTIDLPQPSLLFCENKLEPFIVPSVKLAEQAWNSCMTLDDSLKGVLVPGSRQQGTMDMKLGS